MPLIRGFLKTEGFIVNKQTYKLIRRSIRENGLRYTAHVAAETSNFPVLEICDSVANLIKQTDWLAMRAQFARNETAAIAFKLTMPQWLDRRGMDFPIIWGKQ